MAAALKQVTPEELAKIQDLANVQTSQGAVSYNMDMLVKFGKLEKSIRIADSLDVIISTLSDEDRQKALSLVPDQDLQAGILTRFELIKRAVLVYAIVKLGDATYDTDAQKAELHKQLGQMQSLVIDHIYESYQGLLDEQKEILKSGFKKK